MNEANRQGDGLESETRHPGPGAATGGDTPGRDLGPRELLLLSLLATYVLFASEWLFFVTKPSMFSELSPLRDVVILLITPLLLLPWIVLACCALMIVWLMLAHYTSGTSATSGRWCRMVVLAMPALILTAVELLLIENVTQTLFGFHLGSFSGPLRYVYGAGLLGLTVWTYMKLDGLTRQSSWPARSRALPRLVGGLTMASLCAAGVQFAVSDRAEAFARPAQAAGGLPNIVILSAEALLATHMSAWDDYRETNAFLEEFTKETLFFENSFTNAANSTGSIGSLMTGKLPTQTRVVYAPDRMKGRDSLEHLPGILRSLGYRNADISIIHYADAFDMNIRDGFDMANGRSEADQLPRSFIPKPLELAFESEIFFYGKVRQRLQERLLHAFGVRDITDPYEEVMQARVHSLDKPFGYFQSDERRVEMMIDFVESGPGPFFVHLHCQGTHGQRYKPQHVRYSRGKKQDDIMMADFYDDAIIDFDFIVKDVVDYLKQKGLYDDTLIVITSDHGMGREGKTRSRIPLAIKFPGGAHRGRVTVNTQRLDLAPTLLDVLGVEAPDWMSGESLLSADLDPLRPILSSHVADREALVMDWIVATDVKPPFYSLGHLALVQCQSSFKLNLQTGRIRQVSVPGHTAPCPEEDLFSLDEARGYLIEHLRENGYDVSSLDPE